MIFINLPIYPFQILVYVEGAVATSRSADGVAGGVVDWPPGAANELIKIQTFVQRVGKTNPVTAGADPAIDAYISGGQRSVYDALFGERGKDGVNGAVLLAGAPEKIHVTLPTTLQGQNEIGSGSTVRSHSRLWSRGSRNAHGARLHIGNVSNLEFGVPGTASGNS